MFSAKAPIVLVAVLIALGGVFLSLHINQLSTSITTLEAVASHLLEQQSVLADSMVNHTKSGDPMVKPIRVAEAATAQAKVVAAAEAVHVTTQAKVAETPPCNVNASEVEKLQAFNDKLPSIKTTQNRFDARREPLMCFMRVMMTIADKVQIFSWQGTSLASFRGWAAPWDHDFDFGYELNNITKKALDAALQGDTKGDMSRYTTLFPECAGLIFKAIPKGQTTFQLQRINGADSIFPQEIQGTSFSFGLWPLIRNKRGVGTDGDVLCGWICVPVRDIFPVQFVDVDFYEPPADSSSAPYSLGRAANILPTMSNLTGFMDRYPPFHNARTHLSYNYYNVTLGSWTFDIPTHCAFNNDGGPPLVMGL